MNFKVGDRVRTSFQCFDDQIGTITRIWNSGSFPIMVDFESSKDFPSNSKELSLVHAVEEPDECAAFFS